MKTQITSSISGFSIIIILLIALTGFKSPDVKNAKLASSGELNFTVRTVTENGNYAPKHVLAIWVEYEGDFVKTRLRRGNTRKQYLYTWKAITTAAGSPYNVVDAITGATLTSHTTHSVTWDCLDLDGNVVPDGEYTIWVEFTEKHAQGPLYSLSFTKGPDAQTITPSNETYFKDIELDFTPIVADFNADVTVVCEDGSPTFTSESINATEWSWDFGNGATPANANTEGPHTISYSSPGFKTVSLAVNGSLTETKENYIEVVSNPVAEFDFSGLDFTVDFVNTSSNADSYIWDFGDGNTSTEQNPTHTFAVGGSYIVNLSAMNAICSDENSQEVMVPMVGILEIQNANQISINPNPNNGTFTVELENLEQIKEINVMDMAGRTTAFSYSLNPFSILVDMEGNDNGIYFLQIISERNIYSKKFVVK